MTIDPLRSGAPGGSWSVQKTKHQDGSPVVAAKAAEPEAAAPKQPAP
jgi:hypothetical protein